MTDEGFKVGDFFITPAPPWVEAYLDSLRSDYQLWTIKLPGFYEIDPALYDWEDEE